MTKKEIKKIAEAHWVFIEKLFFSLPDDANYGMSTVEFLYKEAFIHGWKHALNKNKN